MFKKKLFYLMPPIIIDIARVLRQLRLHRDKYELIKNNRILKDKYLDGRVYILANGPSLTEQTIDSLSGEKVIVMNDFYKGECGDKLDIVACCFAEPISSSSFCLDNVKEMIRSTNSKSLWLDISLSTHDLTDVSKSLCYTIPGWEPKLFWKSTIALDQVTLVYQTTAQLAIQVAIYMGFKDIQLYGFDHDWLASPDYSKHFYSDEKDETDHLHLHSYHSIINLMDRMWDIYETIDRLSTRNGIKITNRNPKSYLDVFDKK
jgi:hypothetical protein